MKTIALALILFLAMGCYKEPNPKQVPVSQYQVPIKFANYNEPGPMNYFVFYLNSRYYYYAHTQVPKDFSKIEWSQAYQLEFDNPPVAQFLIANPYYEKKR